MFIKNGGWLLCLALVLAMGMLSVLAPKGMDLSFHIIAWAVSLLASVAIPIGLMPDKAVAKELRQPQEGNVTREWVEMMMNKSLANVMHVNGSTHENINRRLARVETITNQGGYLVFVDDKSVNELGFDYLVGVLFRGHKSYMLCDVELSKDVYPRVVSARVVEKDDPRFKANSEANYNHVCENYSGRGSELSTEVGIDCDLADRLVTEYKASKA